MQIAQEAWGGEVPDFVEALVRACDAAGSSQNKVASKIGYSGAVISQIIRNSYGAETGTLEARVRAVYMDGAVDCPALGSIEAAGCLAWRDKAKALRSASPLVVQMFNQCRRCPRYKGKRDE